MQQTARAGSWRLAPDGSWQLESPSTAAAVRVLHLSELSGRAGSTSANEPAPPAAQTPQPRERWMAPDIAPAAETSQPRERWMTLDLAMAKDDQPWQDQEARHRGENAARAVTAAHALLGLSP